MMSLPHSTHTTVGDNLAHRQTMLQYLRENLQVELARMKYFVDKNRIDKVLNKGDFVYLKLQPLQASFSSSKKNFKAQFQILWPLPNHKKIGSSAYRLALPAGSQIHLVSHVSPLKKRASLGVVARLQPSISGQDGRLMVQAVAIF